MNIHSLYALILPYFRRKRFEMFTAALSPSTTDSILDIGGYPDNWLQHERVANRVDILNLTKTEYEPSDSPSHQIETVAGDGTALAYDDDSYEIVFSNSVIEHVGDWQAQQQFAAEARRVGKRLWIQTPAREFFFEPHYLTPFVHWVPLKHRHHAARFTLWALLGRHDRSAVRDMVDEIRLLDYSEMLALFPDCEIRREKVLGFMTKSYIAVRTS